MTGGDRPEGVDRPERVDRPEGVDRRDPRITEIRIRASAILSPEALQQAYEMLTKETPLEGSRLLVEVLQDERACPACGNSWMVTPDDVAGHVLVCPSCGAPFPLGRSADIEVVAIGRSGA